MIKYDRVTSGCVNAAGEGTAPTHRTALAQGCNMRSIWQRPSVDFVGDERLAGAIPAARRRQTPFGDPSPS